MNRRAFVGRLGVAAGLVFTRRWPAPERLVERWSWAMGQPVHLMVFARSEQHGLDACASTLAELRGVEARLSLFDDASDLCELNRHAGRGALRMGEDLRRVLDLAERFRRATGGAFNVAVEPLMRVWGFHEPRRPEPTPTEIAEAREAVRPTGLGYGVAVPHGTSSTLPDLRLAAGTTAEPVRFDSLDGQPVRLFFLLVGPEHPAGAHLKALSRIARLVRREPVRQRLLAARDADAFYRSLCELERP